MMETITTTFMVAGFMFAGGFFFTVGMWAFCRCARWTPVNITLNVETDTSFKVNRSA